jgi:nitrite reductase (NO-forming)
MIPFHVAMGMSGAIMVLPRDGLRDEQGNPVKYDRAYYIGEQGFYFPKDTDGNHQQYSSTLDALPYVLGEMRQLIRSHVVFNGRVNSLTDENALTAKLGEKVLLIHSQGNEDTWPTLVGETGRLVWTGGSFSDQPITDQETWFVPGGAAVAVLYELNQAGTFDYINSGLAENTQSGPIAHLIVE